MSHYELYQGYWEQSWRSTDPEARKLFKALADREFQTARVEAGKSLTVQVSDTDRMDAQPPLDDAPSARPSQGATRPTGWRPCGLGPRYGVIA